MIWSLYKYYNIVKLLVFIFLLGLFIFFLKFWVGFVLDKKIVEEFGFLNNLEYGDDIMVDRGFMISGVFVFKGCILNILFFICGK